MEKYKNWLIAGAVLFGCIGFYLLTKPRKPEPEDLAGETRPTVVNV